MDQSTEDKIALLEEFDSLLDGWFSGMDHVDGRDAVRRALNEMAPTARTLVQEAGCSQRVTVGPPPAIGGPLLQNVDPFDMLFDRPYGMSLIPRIRDMTQQAIGVFRTGRIPQVAQAPKKKETIVLTAPEKVTLIWLVHNVPVKLWLGAVGVIAAVFLFGVKAGQSSFVQLILGNYPH